MPELPEVEVVRRGLAPLVIGRSVLRAEILHPRTSRRQVGGAGEFANLLRGREIVGTGRRGKFLWLSTDDPDLVLIAHLGMSGQFRVGNEPTEVHRHARARIDLGEITLWFRDQRTFGWLAAAPMAADRAGIFVPTFVQAIAPDPTESIFDRAKVAKVIRGRGSEIKRLLLDQSVVSGIGNIYADEALWRSKVHPRRRSDQLSLPRIGAVLKAATEVMAEALVHGGTSFDALYVGVNGESGYFGRNLRAYGQSGRPCQRCSTPIIREAFMNRSSHYCPKCQRPSSKIH